MKRISKGQSLVDFIVLTALVVALIFIGVYQFGDNLADLLASTNPEKKFNNARTMRYEKPEDLISNVNITLDDGTSITPPIEKVIKQGLAAGAYIQTSGTTAQIAQMGKVMEEYVSQLQNLATTGASGEAAFLNALSDYSDQIDDRSGNGLLGGYDPSDDSLTQKLHFVEMAFSSSISGAAEDLSDALDNYVSNIPEQNKKNIIETFTKELINSGKQIEYFIDPYLYVKFLGENKTDDPSQDMDLITAINAASLTEEEKGQIAGQIKVNYSGGYSQTSPGSYNGERMCSTYGGTMASDTDCVISAD